MTAFMTLSASTPEETFTVALAGMLAAALLLILADVVQPAGGPPLTALESRIATTLLITLCTTLAACGGCVVMIGMIMTGPLTDADYATPNGRHLARLELRAERSRLQLDVLRAEREDLVGSQRARNGSRE